MAFSEFLDRLVAEEDVPPVYAGALPTEESSACPESWRYETSTASRNTVHASRRAGKNVAGRRRAARRLGQGRPDRPKQPVWCHLASLIRRNAKKHWWNPIKQLLQDLGWHRMRVWETDMILRLDNGSYLQCLGVDDEADVARLQGDYSDLIIGDEAHLPRDNVQKAFSLKPFPC